MRLRRVLRAARDEIDAMMEDTYQEVDPPRWGTGTPSQQLRQGVRNVRDRLRHDGPNSTAR